jgi:hypothetical protein
VITLPPREVPVVKERRQFTESLTSEGAFLVGLVGTGRADRIVRPSVISLANSRESKCQIRRKSRKNW